MTMPHQSLRHVTATLADRCEAFLAELETNPKADLTVWARNLIKDCDRLEEHLAATLVSELKKQRHIDEQTKKEHHRRIAQDIQAIY